MAKRPHPALSELILALDTLSKDEVRYVCLLLGVPDTTLNNIESNPLNINPLTCVTKYLSALIDRDVPLTWGGISDVLCTKRLGKTALAQKIRKDHEVPTTSNLEPTTVPDPQVLSIPFSPRSSDSDSVSSTSDVGTSDAPRSLSKQPFPTPPRSSDDHNSPSPPRSRLRTKNQPLATMKSYLSQERLAKKVNSFKRRFRGIVISANVDLSKRLSRNGFERFKVDLTTLPMLGNTHHFLQQESERIMGSSSVREVFRVLDPYWNHIDFALLEHIIHRYCGRRLKKDMKRYKCKLYRFEKVTSVKMLGRARADFRGMSEPPRGHKSVTLTLNIDGEECSLYQARKMKEAIAEQTALEPYVTLLHGLHASRVILELAFPRIIFLHLKRVLEQLFVLESGGVIQQFKFREKIFSLDPLTLLKEDITYCIRRNELREEVRVAGEKEFKAKCQEIARNEVLTFIQSRWKSSKVEIHISGFSVTNTLESINKAFLAPESEPSEEDEAVNRDIDDVYYDTKMPDPPANVNEELCYFINNINLKPDLRDSGFHILQDICNGIESQTQVSVQLKKEPDGLEFQISGPEERVAASLEYVKQEFEILSSVPEDKEWVWTPLTEETLQQHNKRMEKQVRQFNCGDCYHVWWRVVPSHKPVSRCKMCRSKYDPLPRNREEGVGQYTCVNPDCRHVFSFEYDSNAKICPKCLKVISRPIIHPSNAFRTMKRIISFLIADSKLHNSTGSTRETYLPQDDLFKPQFPTNFTNKRSSSLPDLRCYEKTKCPHLSKSRSNDRQSLYALVPLESSNFSKLFRKLRRIRKRTLSLHQSNSESSLSPPRECSSTRPPHTPPLYRSSSRQSLAGSRAGSVGSQRSFGSGHSSVGSVCRMR